MMLTSLAFVFLAGLAAAALCQQLHLPRIIGMLAVGVVLGPCVLNVLDDSILSISADLRQMALIIILLKAGLSLNLADLKKVGRPAVPMSFLPASFEIAAYVLLAPVLLGLTMAEAAVMGAVMAAVSPAVVVPRMVRLMEEGWGTKQGIPQMVMAGASCDDIFVIVLFSTFLGMAQGQGADLAAFASIPVSIVCGVLLGAAVDVRYTMGAGLGVVAMIALALVFRAAGVTLCLAGTALSRKERLFCVIAYLPKATVQAAIGSVPLAAGLACGQLVLSVAVVGILLAAPLGALGMDLTYKKLLQGPQEK